MCQRAFPLHSKINFDAHWCMFFKLVWLMVANSSTDIKKHDMPPNTLKRKKDTYFSECTAMLRWECTLLNIDTLVLALWDVCVKMQQYISMNIRKFRQKSEIFYIYIYIPIYLFLKLEGWHDSQATSIYRMRHQQLLAMFHSGKVFFKAELRKTKKALSCSLAAVRIF